jgi:hypothetical protein
MNKKIFAFSLAILTMVLAISPVMAFGPGNAKNNRWLTVAFEGTNIQLWLPSGVMNEWIENPAYPGPIRVQVKDAAKFQILTATVATSVPEVLLSDNQWFYLDQSLFAILLGAVGANPAIAAEYTDGAYMKVTTVGW